MSAHQRERHGTGGGQFAFTISPVSAAAHELKSPLVLIRQLALATQQPGVSDADRERLIAQLTLTSERALRLTNDLTKSARLEDAMFDLEPINAQELCREVVEELSSLFAAEGRRLVVQKRKNPLLLVANRDLLRRILINFTDNAFYYTDSTAAIELQVQSLKRGSIVRLGVRDYGPAIPTDIWRTLEKKLSHAPQPIHARPQSSGLGLYIAGLFAETMNGKIGITRHRDGATFFVDLDASHQMSLI